jgi:hypothetical protein
MTALSTETHTPAGRTWPERRASPGGFASGQFPHRGGGCVVSLTRVLAFFCGKTTRPRD